MINYFYLNYKDNKISNIGTNDRVFSVLFTDV